MRPEWRTREQVLVAPWGMRAADSRGRVHPEDFHRFRSPYQRDRDRIIHSAAFRRLAHKTQVFTGYPGDYHRSRLTHTLEVASIARTLARAFALNEDLVEALALAHDIGHPPYGHAGEDTLDELLAGQGGFNHNAQALRIVELIEHRYPRFPGLNLSREFLESQSARATPGKSAPSLLEAQVVDAADSIAYDSADADDAVELGFVRLDELLELPLVSRAAERVRSALGRLPPGDERLAVLHEIVDMQVEELVERTLARIENERIGSTSEVLAAGRLMDHAPATQQGKVELERFLFERVYRSPTVLAVRQPAQRRLAGLFDWYRARPETLPPRFRARVDDWGAERSVADYVAGMTDRFLEREFERLIGP
ncbi:MAG: dGTP triphosphohydrolase [Planctomycetaceae bacterium]